MDGGGEAFAGKRDGAVTPTGWRGAATGLGPSAVPRPCRARVPQPRRSPSPPFVPAASAGLLENCTGCVLCSEDNGCITCHHRLFLLIWRDGIRQYGMCVHTCPPGYFGVRGLEVNRCTSTSRDSQGPPPPAPPSAPTSPRRPAVGRAMAAFPAASPAAQSQGQR